MALRLAEESAWNRDALQLVWQSALWIRQFLGRIASLGWIDSL